MSRFLSELSTNHRKIVDTNLPNVGIHFFDPSEDDMALARALQRRGNVNVILMYHYRVRETGIHANNYSVYVDDKIQRIQNSRSSLVLDSVVMDLEGALNPSLIERFYTEQHPEFSRITRDKVKTKRILQAARVPTAKGRVMEKISDESEKLAVCGFLYANPDRCDFVSKPVDGNGGVGVLIFSNSVSCMSTLKKNCCWKIELHQCR